MIRLTICATHLCRSGLANTLKHAPPHMYYYTKFGRSAPKEGRTQKSGNAGAPRLEIGAMADLLKICHSPTCYHTEFGCSGQTMWATLQGFLQIWCSAAPPLEMGVWLTLANTPVPPYVCYRAESDRCESNGTSARMEIRWQNWVCRDPPLNVTQDHWN